MVLAELGEDEEVRQGPLPAGTVPLRATQTNRVMLSGSSSTP